MRISLNPLTFAMLEHLHGSYIMTLKVLNTLLSSTVTSEWTACNALIPSLITHIS